MRKLEALIRDEAKLREFARKLMEVFPEQENLKRIWRLLPTQYVTIPLQGTAYLGTYQYKNPPSKRVSATHLVGLFLRFCQMREGQMLARATFNEVVGAQDIPRFSQLHPSQLYWMVESSCKILKPFIEKKPSTKKSQL